MRHWFNKYRVWVVSTAAEARLYLWDNWKDLVPLVDELVALSSAAAYMKSHQALGQRSGWLGFGRMSWTRENNEKWATKHRDAPGGAEVRFFDTQVWAPDLNDMDRTGSPPDLFLRLFNEPASAVAREGLVIAIRHSIAKRHASIIDRAVAGLSDRIEGSTVACLTRSWFPGAGFVNELADLNPQELERVVAAHGKPSPKA